jgi:hypothetical protein
MKRRRPLQRGQTNTSSANGFGGWVTIDDGDGR